MPKYVIEREIPEAGKLSAQQLQAISQKSCGFNAGLPWQQSRSPFGDGRIGSSTLALLSSLKGLNFLIIRFFPALKRWAIFSEPQTPNKTIYLRGFSN